MTPLQVLWVVAAFCTPALAAGSEVVEMVVPLDIDETSIAAGIEHSCAIQTDTYNDVGGRVVCWGVNNGHQSSPPGGEFIQVSSGRLHSCGIRIDETLQCWGIGAPVKNPEGLFEQVSSGDFHACAIMKDQTVQCWGTATGGISSAPSGRFVQGQLDVDPSLRFRQISSASGEFACGVTEQNDVVCWGDNHRGQATPPRGVKFNLVSTSRLAACGIKTDKTAVCWGMRSGVTAVPTNVQFDELTLGWNHGCAIRFEDGGVQCWGDRSSNRLEVPLSLR